MDFSREELMQEAKRRGMNVPNQQFSREQLLTEAKRRGLHVPNTSIGQDILGSIKGVPGKIWGVAENIPELYKETLGFYKQALNPLDKLRYIQNMIGGYAKAGIGASNIPANISEYLGKKGIINPETAEFMSRFKSPLTNENIPELLGREGQRPGDIYIEKGTEFLPYGAAGGPIAGSAVHALGQNEDPLQASIMASIAKYGPKGIQKGAGAIEKGFSKYNSENIANKIVGDRNLQMNKYNNLYEDFLSKVKERNVKVPKIGIKEKDVMAAADPKKFTKSIEIYEKHKTFENAFEARKTIKKYIRNIENKDPRARSLPEDHGLEAAKRAEKTFDHILEQGLKNSGQKDLIKEFMEINKGYKKDVVPYEELKELRKYRKGKLSAEDFVKDIQAKRNYAFRKQKGELYPEISTSKIFRKAKSLAGHAAATTAGIGVLHGLF